MVKPFSTARSRTISAALVSWTLAGVTTTARTKPSEQLRTWRLMPLILLLPSNPRSPRLRARNNALRVQDAGRRLRPMAVGFAHPPRQIGSGRSPDALGPEPVIPAAHRLVRTEVTRQRPPGTARMLQVETGVHRLAHIGSEG